MLDRMFENTFVRSRFGPSLLGTHKFGWKSIPTQPASKFALAVFAMLRLRSLLFGCLLAAAWAAEASQPASSPKTLAETVPTERQVSDDFGSDAFQPDDSSVSLLQTHADIAPEANMELRASPQSLESGKASIDGALAGKYPRRRRRRPGGGRSRSQTPGRGSRPSRPPQRPP